jgi:putative flippase GtrA
MRTLTLEFFRYGLASAAALGVDAGLLAGLVTLFGWNYVPASITSFIAGGVVAYVLCVRFVFPYRRIKTPALELPYFIVLGLIGLGVNSLILYLAVERLSLHFLVGKIAAAGCTFATNFLLRRYSLFSPLQPRLDQMNG